MIENHEEMNESSGHDFKNDLYEQFSRICKSLGSARRFELLDILAQGEHTVEELALETDMSVANTSQHLQQLRGSRLVEVRRRGIEMVYRLADDTVSELLSDIQKLAEARLAEVDRIIEHYQEERSQFKLVGFSEIQEVLKNNGSSILDIRPESEYMSGHIPSALSIPLEALEGWLAQLPREKPIIVCGRNYYSSLADRAVRLLLEKGYDASRIDLGFAEWKMAGLPIERGSISS